jgi:hypothetical protein
LEDIKLENFKDIRFIRNITSVPIFTIYNSPKDYPNTYVARLWTIDSGKPVSTKYFVVNKNLDILRSLLPIYELGLVCFERNTNDDLCIVETWL